MTKFITFEQPESDKWLTALGTGINNFANSLQRQRENALAERKQKLQEAKEERMMKFAELNNQLQEQRLKLDKAKSLRELFKDQRDEAEKEELKAGRSTWMGFLHESAFIDGPEGPEMLSDGKVITSNFMKRLTAGMAAGQINYQSAKEAKDFIKDFTEGIRTGGTYNFKTLDNGDILAINSKDPTDHMTIQTTKGGKKVAPEEVQKLISNMDKQLIRLKKLQLEKAAQAVDDSSVQDLQDIVVPKVPLAMQVAQIFSNVPDEYKPTVETWAKNHKGMSGFDPFAKDNKTLSVMDASGNLVQMSPDEFANSQSLNKDVHVATDVDIARAKAVAQKFLPLSDEERLNIKWKFFDRPVMMDFKESLKFKRLSDSAVADAKKYGKSEKSIASVLTVINRLFRGSIDQNSTVRAAEAKSVPEAQAYLDNIKAIMQQVGGDIGMLSETQFRRLVESLDNFHKTMAEAAREEVYGFVSTLTNNAFDPIVVGWDDLPSTVTNILGGKYGMVYKHVWPNKGTRAIAPGAAPVPGAQNLSDFDIPD